MRGWGEAFDRRQIGGFADARQRASGRTGALRRVDCNQLPRDCRVLRAAGLLLSGLCVLCVLCGCFLLLLLLLLLLKQTTTENTESTEQSREEKSRANGGAAAGRTATAVHAGRRGVP